MKSSSTRLLKIATLFMFILVPLIPAWNNLHNNWDNKYDEVYAVEYAATGVCSCEDSFYFSVSYDLDNTNAANLDIQFSPSPKDPNVLACINERASSAAWWEIIGQIGFMLMGAFTLIFISVAVWFWKNIWSLSDEKEAESAKTPPTDGGVE